MVEELYKATVCELFLDTTVLLKTFMISQFLWVGFLGITKLGLLL